MSTNRHIHFSVSRKGAFIAAFSPKRKLAEGVAIDELERASHDLNGLRMHFSQYFGGHLDDVELKIITSDPDANRILNGMKSWGAAQLETIVRPPEVLQDIWFDMSTGRVRIKNSTPNKKLRVLVVDDSLTIRQLLSAIISQTTDMEVAAATGEPSEVRDLILKHNPDVMTLDIHMPGMDGVTLLKKLMPEFKIRTVMISSLSPDDGPLVFEAMAAGAIDYIQKPSFKELDNVAPIMLEKMRAAATARATVDAPRVRAKSVAVKGSIPRSQAVLAIGSSTGGPEALRELLEGFDANIPPTVIAQHIPAEFSKALAHRLNQLFPFEVREAANGDRLQKGLVLIAPGGNQMRVKADATGLYVVITPAEKREVHNPSVDVLFKSLAEVHGSKTVATVLTGMGRDGGHGCVALKGAGAVLFAQDEASSIVYGMPKAALEMAAVPNVVALSDMAAAIQKSLR